MTRPRILYLSYDGMLEPLGQSQVVAYLERLAARSDIRLISFEKPEDRADRTAMAAMRKRLEAAGIGWYALRYHRRLTAPATAYDMLRGLLVALWIMIRHRPRIVHARSYVPMLIALPLKRLTGARVLFDMRGFWADERVDGGLWPAGGALYRGAKALEQRALLAADWVVSLTHAGVAEMERFPYLAQRRPPMTVIPTCADLDRFRPVIRAREPGLVLGIIGSVGTWYLLDDMLAFFQVLREARPDARLLIVNRGEHDLIRARLATTGIPPAAIDLKTGDHAQMPAMLSRLDAAVLFIKPAYSKIASAPTKLGELLGCGVPCVVNAGVGDLATTIAEDDCGAMVERFDTAALEAAAARLLALADDAEIAGRCRAAALKRYDLADGAERYQAIYGVLSKIPANAHS